MASVVAGSEISVQVSVVYIVDCRVHVEVA